MQPQPYATPVHYDWLEQGRDDAHLSDAQPIALEPLDLRSVSPDKFVETLREYGFAIISHHGVEGDDMFGMSKRLFGRPDAEKKVTPIECAPNRLGRPDFFLSFASFFLTTKPAPGFVQAARAGCLADHQALAVSGPSQQERASDSGASAVADAVATHQGVVASNAPFAAATVAGLLSSSFSAPTARCVLQSGGRIHAAVSGAPESRDEARRQGDV